MVLDRLFLIIFSVVCFVGTGVILMQGLLFRKCNDVLCLFSPNVLGPTVAYRPIQMICIYFESVSRVNKLSQ